MRLYHYRAISSSIPEIKNHTFRFASVEELNDPIEGYFRVFWKGDKPAWEGLMRNYICSFYNALSLYFVGADEDGFMEQICNDRCTQNKLLSCRKKGEKNNEI